MPAGQRSTGRRARSRYAHIGRLYDLISLENLLYRRPRRALMAMLGPRPGATVLDVGCGTGLNFPELQRLIGPKGRIIGIDPSASMLAGAGRRVRSAGWTNVALINARMEDVPAALATAGVPPDAIGAIVATFVISILDHHSEFWRAVDQLAAAQPVRVAIADVGKVTRAGAARRAALQLLTALGGGDVEVQPWAHLAANAKDVVHVSECAGHVHLAVGTIDAR